MVTPEHHVALVDRLVQRSEPVRPLWPIRARYTVVLACWATAGALIVWMWPRPDLATRLHERSFVLSLATLATACALASLLALRSAVPGRAPTRLEVGLLLMLIAAAALSVIEPATSGEELAPGWTCGLRTLMLAMVPWMMLLLAIRRGAPVQFSRAGAYAGAAALLAATTVLRATCPETGTSHWLGWHLGTAALALLGSVPLAAAWLRTWRNHVRPN